MGEKERRPHERNYNEEKIDKLNILNRYLVHVTKTINIFSK